MAVNANRVLTGSAGNVWLNGRLLSQIKSVELKITGSFEDVSFVGSYATESVYTGWTGEGTLTMQKIDSTVLDLMADAYSSGAMPEIKIITKVTDKSTGQSERAAVSNVVVTEFLLAKFENKTLLEEELPLKFSKYEVLETIS